MKKKYLKSVFAVLLAAAMAVPAPVKASAETYTMSEDGTTWVSQDDLAVSAAAETGDKIQLEAPKNLRWGENYSVVFTAVPETEGYFGLELYCNDELVHSTTWSWGTVPASGKIELDMAEQINESGTYYFRVCSLADYDPETYTDSEWVTSGEIVYTRPDIQLGTTIASWSEEEAGVFYYESVENAGGYYKEYYFTPAGSDQERYIGASWFVGAGDHDKAGVIKEDNIRYIIQRYGAGKYRVRIRALSGDLDHYANGEWGEYSAYYDTTITADKIKDILGGALTDAAPSEALDTIKNAVDIKSMQEAMQTDTEVLGQMKALEEKYAAEKNISVETPSVSEEAAAYVDASKIDVVGAGLNVGAGSVGLEVSVPEKKEYVSESHYKNAVQLAIELKNDEASVHELEVPVTVTMPIPAGIDASRLVILHYHTDGTFEAVTLKNNGDGTVSFTVTDFSTFVFAEAVTEDDADDSDQGGNKDDVKDDADQDDSKDDVKDDADDSDQGGNKDDVKDDVDQDDSKDDVKDDADQEVVVENNVKFCVDWTAGEARIEEAIALGEQNVNITAGEEVQAPLHIMQKLAGKQITLALHTGKGVAVSVTGSSNMVMNSGLDLVITEQDHIPAVAKNSIAGVVCVKTLHIEENETLPAHADLHVAVGKEYAGRYANLYRYDASDNSMKPAGAYLVNEDGQAMFALTQGGDYVVMVSGSAAAAVTGDGHVVVSGDTLSGIALKYGVTLKALQEANPQLTDIDKIYPGQIIYVR